MPDSHDSDEAPNRPGTLPVAKVCRVMAVLRDGFRDTDVAGVPTLGVPPLRPRPSFAAASSPYIHFPFLCAPDPPPRGHAHLEMPAPTHGGVALRRRSAAIGFHHRLSGPVWDGTAQAESPQESSAS